MFAAMHLGSFIIVEALVLPLQQKSRSGRPRSGTVASHRFHSNSISNYQQHTAHATSHGSVEGSLTNIQSLLLLAFYGIILRLNAPVFVLLVQKVFQKTPEYKGFVMGDSMGTKVIIAYCSTSTLRRLCSGRL